MNLLVAVATGLLFALGLCISGLTSPRLVAAFLDVADWNPRLLATMFGAVVASFAGWQIKNRMARPLVAPAFPLQLSSLVDARLAIGSVVFGVGWGLAGYCPGPAIVSFGGGARQAWIFLPAMVAGIGLFELWERRRSLVRDEEEQEVDAQEADA